MGDNQAVPTELRQGRRRILFLAHLLPWPLDGGGQIKSYNTLRILAAEYDVTLLAFTRRAGEEAHTAALEPYCTGGVQWVRLPRGAVRNAAGALLSLVQHKSFIVSRDDYSGMTSLVEDTLADAADRRRPFDAIHVDHLQMMSFVPADCDARVVLDDHNVEHRIPQRMGEAPDTKKSIRWFAEREWPKLRDYEAEACRRADRVLAVSREDADALTALDPDRLASKIAVVPIGVDLESWAEVTPREDASEILSIGTMYWPPNVDALLYFCSEILPIIRKTIPGVRLTIVGARPVAAIRELAEYDPLITVTGLVDDVRPYAEKGAVFIVPLRSGSGMRVKILNAMAMHLPVVSTTVGAEGIDVTDGQDILLADYPRAFANAVIELLQDRDRAHAIGQAGRRLMEESYDWNAVGRRLLQVYADLLPPNPVPAPKDAVSLEPLPELAGAR